MTTSQKPNYVARYWKNATEDKIQCQLCPRNCQLAAGQRGFCFVRQNIAGKLILTTYGRSSGFCIDPIEKKPLYHFYPGTAVLSFGTAGCNLGCQFCQNWDISRSKEFARLSDQASAAAIARCARETGCQSVAFTYNDPVIFAEYAIDAAQACHQQGVKTVAVTAGYIQGQAREDFFAHMDAANVDLKSFSDDFYQKLALGSLQPVLDTLVYIKKQTEVWLEITTLLIPGTNDSDQELEALSSWIVDNLGPEVPVHFSAFHPDYRFTAAPATPIGTLRRARQIALNKGLHYVYTGNVYDQEGGTTFCHACGKHLIVRDGYVLKAYELLGGDLCDSCRTPVSGHFGEEPGTWGTKRLPVQINDYEN